MGETRSQTDRLPATVPKFQTPKQRRRDANVRRGGDDDDDDANKSRRSPPSNALLVNFPCGCVVDESIVRVEFEKFGRVRSALTCSVDCCQAFVVLDDDIRRVGTDVAVMTAESVADKILTKTRGILVVRGFIWTIVRPSDGKTTATGYPNSDLVMDGPSPLRPSRTRRLTDATTLMHIYQNYRYHQMQATLSCASTATLVPRTEASTSSRASTASSMTSEASTIVAMPAEMELPVLPVEFTPGFLPLAPPYHLLPDTPFFRSANIIPPPSRANEGVSVLQRILNRYLESMELHDDLQECELVQMEEDVYLDDNNAQSGWYPLETYYVPEYRPFG